MTLAISSTINNQTETQGFGYDPLDRLTSWTLNNTLQERYTYSVNGNLWSKGAPSLSQFSTEPSGKYSLFYDPAHPHAANTMVDSATGSVVNSYIYDSNGNQTTRTLANDGSYTLIYDAENRLVKVVKDDAVVVAQFTYDGDGKQVKSVIDGVTTLYVGGHYEIKNPGSGQEITKYYFAGAQRIAMRRYTVPVETKLEFLLSDHLGSTSITTDSTGVKTSEIKYKPWGEVRYAWVKPDATPGPAYRLNDYTFTGQRSYMDDPTTNGVSEGFGLMFTTPAGTTPPWDASPRPTPSSLPRPRAPRPGTGMPIPTIIRSGIRIQAGILYLSRLLLAWLALGSGGILG